MLELGYLVGVMNGPLKLLTAHKILPVLNLLAKFKRARHAREYLQRPFVTPSGHWLF